MTAPQLTAGIAHIEIDRRGWAAAVDFVPF